MNIIKKLLASKERTPDRVTTSYKEIESLIKNLNSYLAEYVSQIKSNHKASTELVDEIMLNLQNFHYCYNSFLNIIENAEYYSNAKPAQIAKLAKKIKIMCKKIYTNFMHLSTEDSSTRMIKYEMQRILKVENTLNCLSDNT